MVTHPPRIRARVGGTTWAWSLGIGFVAALGIACAVAASLRAHASVTKPTVSLSAAASRVEAAPITHVSANQAPPRAEAVLASMSPAVDTTTVDVQDEVQSAPLDVDLDGRRLVWTKEDVARVTRAGGTHDMRELAAALLGRTDVSVSVAGQTWRGPGTASVDLKQLGPDDELRIWPESDGTWSVARNVSRENGRAIHEHYRLEEVLALRFISRPE